LHYKDSIILINYYSDGDEAWREKRFLDNNGYLSSKIVDSSCPDTVIYKRDSKNRIVEKYRNWFCVDNGQRENTEYELNDNGDVILERSLKHGFAFFDSDESLSNISEIRYDYIYDANLNWVVKVAYQDDEILSITQRELKYY
jgi:hypothetical protein